MSFYNVSHCFVDAFETVRWCEKGCFSQIFFFLKYFLKYPPPPPRVRCFMNLCYISLNNSKNTNHRHISLTGTNQKSLKADLHLVDFSRANDTFRWRMLSFQSPFEENEIGLFVKPHVLFT